MLVNNLVNLLALNNGIIGYLSQRKLDAGLKPASSCN